MAKKSQLSLDDFVKLDRKQQLELIFSSFSNFIRYGLGLSPRDTQQAYFIEQVDEALKTGKKPMISVRSGHGTGKTFMNAALILYIGLGKKDAKIAITAPVSSQLEKILLPEVRKLQDNLFPPLQPLVKVQTDGVKFANGNMAFARTARKENTEAIAGVHGSFVLYIIDEASGVYEGIFEVIEGALTGDNYLLVMTGNPTRTIGTFADSHRKDNYKELYRRIHFSSAKSKNVNQKWVESIAKKYGKDSDVYRVRVLGDFPQANSISLFPTELIERAMSGDIAVYTDGNPIYGVDVARHGDDNTVIARRKGNRIGELITLKNLTTTEIAYRINSIVSDEREQPVIYVDTIGYGAGVFDRLKEMGYDVRDGNVSFKAERFDKYLNKRAEMYANLKEALEKGLKLPNDELLKEELLAISYKFSERSGKMQIITKDEIKELIGRSPDRADAVALTYFTKISSIATHRHINKYQYMGAITEWQAI